MKRVAEFEMKKKIIFWVVGILLVGIAGAIVNVLPTYEDAVAEIREHKAKFANFSFDRDISDLTYTSDKICAVDYITEEIGDCEIDFSYVYNREEVWEVLRVNSTSTIVEDDLAIRVHLERIYSPEENPIIVTYVEDSRIDPDIVP